MKVLDQEFRTNKLRYIFQCAMAGVTMALVLALVAPLTNVVVIASLGASTFIVFALPHVRSSASRGLIGGYAIAIVVGSACLRLRWQAPLPQRLGLIPNLPEVVFGAAAVAAATCAMVVTNGEHPPAAGLALGFVVLDKWHWLAPAAVIVGVIALCAVKYLLRTPNRMSLSNTDGR